MLLWLIWLKRWYWPMIESFLLFNKTRSLNFRRLRERLLLNLLPLFYVKVIAIINMFIIIIFIIQPMIVLIDRNSRMFGYKIVILTTRWLIVRLLIIFLWCHVIIFIVVVWVFMIKIVLLLILLNYILILLMIIIAVVIILAAYRYRFVNYSRLLDWVWILILILVLV